MFYLNRRKYTPTKTLPTRLKGLKICGKYLTVCETSIVLILLIDFILNSVRLDYITAQVCTNLSVITESDNAAAC